MEGEGQRNPECKDKGARVGVSLETSPPEALTRDAA